MVALHRGLPIANLSAFDAREGVVGGNHHRELREVALDDLIAEFSGELDDRRGDLDSGQRVASDQRLARGFGGLALPANRHIAVSTQNTAHTGFVILLRFQRRAAEQLDFNPRAPGLGGD